MQLVLKRPHPNTEISYKYGLTNGHRTEYKGFNIA